MSRLAIELACATGIAPSVWADEGYRAMVTGLEVLKDQERQQR